MSLQQLYTDLAKAYLQPSSTMNAAIAKAYADEAARLGGVVTPPPTDTTSWPDNWTNFPSTVLAAFQELTSPYHASAVTELVQNKSFVYSAASVPIVDSTTNAGYWLNNFRAKVRQGPIATGNPVVFTQGYIEVTGNTGDNTNGIASAGGNGMTISDVKILCGNNCLAALSSFYFSDGVITIDGLYIGLIPGTTIKPLYGINIVPDVGAASVAVSHLRVEKGMSQFGDIYINCPVTSWVDCKYTDGTSIPQPVYVPPPPTDTTAWPDDWNNFPGITFTERTAPFNPTTSNQLVDSLSIQYTAGTLPAVDSSTNSGYRLNNSRIRGRGSAFTSLDTISLNYDYIEVNGQSGDNLNGVLSYGSTGLSITNSKILVGNNCNAALLATGGSTGAITITGLYVGRIPGAASKPAYGIQIVDNGGDSLSVNGLRLEKGMGAVADVIVQIPITSWVDCKYTDGTNIPQPTYTPPPPPDTTTWPDNWTNFPGVTFSERTSPLHIATHGSASSQSIVYSATNDPTVDGTGLTLTNFRIRAREGPRAWSNSVVDPITLSYGYVEVSGVGTDHADGIQSYQGGGMHITNVKILCGETCNSALFAADTSVGTIIIDGLYAGRIPGSATKPAFGVCVNSDGASEAQVSHLRVEKGMSMFGDVVFNCPVTVWNDCKYTDGTSIPPPATYVTTPPPSGSWPNSFTDFGSTSFTNYTGPIHATSPGQLIQNVSINAPSYGSEIIYGDANYKVLNSRIRCGEGPRAHTNVPTIEHCYIEAQGLSDIDHADGVQCYQGHGLNIINTKILIGSYSTAAVFAADTSTGIIDINGLYVGLLPGYSGNLPAYGLCINGDGADEVRVQHLRVEKGMSQFADVRIWANLTVWSDCYYTDGTPIPHP